MNCGSHYNSVFLGSAMSSPSASPAPSVEEFTAEIENSPKRTRIVSVCQNCAMTYRVSCKSVGEFCSKGMLFSPSVLPAHVLVLIGLPSTDCHTTFTIFGRAHCYQTPEKSAAEIRSAIYQFQKKLDDEYSLPPAEEENAQVAPTTVTTSEENKPAAAMVSPLKKTHSSLFGNIFSRRSQQNMF